MERLGKRWGKQLDILAFPSREFFRQEFETDEEIRAFAKKKNFPGTLLKLGKVTGDDVPELWRYFRDATGSKDPSWNFKGKYLISKTGEVSVPTDLEADIERLMK